MFLIAQRVLSAIRLSAVIFRTQRFCGCLAPTTRGRSVDLQERCWYKVLRYIDSAQFLFLLNRKKGSLTTCLTVGAMEINNGETLMGGSSEKSSTLPTTIDLSEAFPGRYPKTSVMCQLKPLRVCLHENKGVISKCVKEVALFESTCTKKIPYVHEKDGLDELTSALYYGRDQFQIR